MNNLNKLKELISIFYLEIATISLLIVIVSIIVRIGNGYKFDYWLYLENGQILLFFGIIALSGTILLVRNR